MRRFALAFLTLTACSDDAGATERGPADAAPARDARAQPVSCNRVGCSASREPCESDLDCCQPTNQPASELTCQAGACDPRRSSDPPDWRVPLPICLPDGGLPACGRGLPCETDADCCGDVAGIPLLCFARRCDVILD